MFFMYVFVVCRSMFLVNNNLSFSLFFTKKNKSIIWFMKIWDVPYGPYFMVAVMFFNWYTICSVLKFVLHYALDMKFIPNPN